MATFERFYSPHSSDQREYISLRLELLYGSTYNIVTWNEGVRMRTGPVTDTRENLSEILEEVVTTGGEYVITKHGRNVAVLLSYEEYESMIESLNILSDNEMMAAIAEAQLDVAEGRVEEI